MSLIEIHRKIDPSDFAQGLYPSCQSHFGLLPNTGRLYESAVERGEMLALGRGVLLMMPQYTENKGYCEDLTEGKFSFPVVHGVRADTSNRQILSKSG